MDAGDDEEDETRAYEDALSGAAAAAEMDPGEPD